MSNPQDPNQWAQQGWQQPGQPPQNSDQTQIAPQYGGGQWPGAQQPPSQPGQFGGYPQQPQPGPYGTQQYSDPQFPGQPYPGQQYGQQFGGHPGQPGPGQPGPGHPGAPKKSRTGLIVGIAAAVVIVIVAAVVGIGALTGVFFGKKFDNAKVNEGVTQVLKQNYNESDTKDVSCNTDGVKVKADATFSCKASIGGKQRTIQVKVLDDNGKYQVGAPS